MLSKFYQVGDNMFYFYTKAQYGHAKGAGVIGNQSNKLYYYGLLLTADDYKYQVAKVGGYEFIINSNGSIQHSYSATYKEDGDELVVVGDQIKYDKNGNYVSGTAEYVADGQYKYGFKSGITNKVSDVDVSQFYKK